MPIETFNFIDSLNASNPVHATDPVSQGDDHIRGVKTTLLNSFPNVDGAVNFTPTEANYVVGVTSAIQTQIDGKAASAHNHDASEINAGTLADARVAESSVTQHEAALAILEAQITDLQNYLLDNAQITTLEVGHASNTTLARKAAGVLSVEGKALVAHNNTSFTSGEIYVSTSAPSGGNDGDIWLEREA